MSEYQKLVTWLKTKTGDRILNFIYIGIWGLIIVAAVSAKRGYYIGSEVDRNNKAFQEYVINNEQEKEIILKNLRRLSVNDSIIFSKIEKTQDSVFEKLDMIEKENEWRERYLNVIKDLKTTPK